MLDYDLSATVNDHLWNGFQSCAELPCSSEEYFASTGAAPTSPDSRRRHRRVRVRGRAAITRRGDVLGVYTIDVSPAGIGFYSPIQLFPKEKVQITIEELGTLALQITRCRRFQKGCYACGASFCDGIMSPGAYRELLRQLKV